MSPKVLTAAHSYYCSSPTCAITKSCWGSLVGALLPIIILLRIRTGTRHAFLLLGGIDPEQVAQAELVLLASAIASGSLGGLDLALWA